MRSIILASGSPRRSMILEQAGVAYQVVLPTMSEEVTDKSIPKEVVENLSRQKAENAASQLPEQTDFLVIGADTIVSCESHILGKPADEEAAAEMLRMLQGRTHQVYTGVSFVYDTTGAPEMRMTHTFHAVTEVEMSPMSEEEIRAYIATGEPMDKAGAYGIQGRGCVYIKSIRGEYNNVVGFPITRIRSEYQKLGL